MNKILRYLWTFVLGCWIITAGLWVDIYAMQHKVWWRAPERVYCQPTAHINPDCTRRGPLQ